MKPPPDEPLPATTIFVFGMGALFIIGWFAMYIVLRERW
jgi:hypothetical protein